MSTVAAPSTERITTEGLSLVLGGRTYGEQRFDTGGHFDYLKNMQVPEALSALSGALMRESALYALAPTVPPEAVHRAYGEDLNRLNRYQHGFKEAVRLAVMCRGTGEQKQQKEFLLRITEKIGEIANELTLHLDVETLELLPAEMLETLKREYAEDVENLKVSVAAWMHALAETEHVSVIERFGDSAARYHFFKMDSEVTKLEQKIVQDPGRKLHGRHAEADVTEQVEVFGERNTHLVVGVETYTLDEYRRSVPTRIANLINSMPEEIRQFVTIIDGTVTEATVTKKLISHTVTKERKSVWISDPAVALFGEWALGGWGGVGGGEAADDFYRGHRMERAGKALFFELVTTVVAAFATLLFGGIGFAFSVLGAGVVLTSLHQFLARRGVRGKR